MAYSKYRAKPTVVDNIRFDSKREANRYSELKLMERAGQITGLECQPRFEIRVNDVKACVYFADFSYRERGKYVVEDVKSKPTKTPVYRLKVRLLKILYPDVDHREIA